MVTQKNHQSKIMGTLITVVIFLVAVVITIPSCNKNDRSGDGSTMAPPPPPAAETVTDIPFEVVDEMPIFKGGEIALLKYIAENTRYPETAKLSGIQGKVVIRFAVEANGSIDRVSVLRGVDPDLDQEAIRVISSLPDFEKPGIKDGKAVAVWYAVPINFALR
jgi:protein TonB